jgi:hypothetical protein
MVEVKLSGKPLAQRVQDRTKNSGEGAGTNPDVTVQTGNSPNRTFTNIHHTTNKQSGGDTGGKR